FVTDDPNAFAGSAAIFHFGSQGYGLGLSSAGVPFLTKVDVSLVSGSAGVTDTSWHHVAVTKSGSTVVFYVDGAPSSPLSYNATFQFTAPAAIGGRGDHLDVDNNQSFFGSIDEFEIFNRALSSNEVAAIFNAGSAGKCKPECVPAPSGL